jgi:hypothetical protein
MRSIMTIPATTSLTAPFVQRDNVALTMNDGHIFVGTLIWDTENETLIIRDDIEQPAEIVVLSDSTFRPDAGCLYIKEYRSGRGIDRIDYRGLTKALLNAGVIKRSLITHTIGQLSITHVEVAEDLGAAAAAPSAPAPLTTEQLIASIEDIVHRETGQHVFRNGWDGSFQPAAGELVELLKAAGHTVTS